MNIKRFLSRFILVFAISLVVTLGVSFLWDLLLHGKARIDWETSFRFAILLGIILTVVQAEKK